MVMQFGYVTLFAAAFPLAGFFSLCCNWIEIRSDLFKCCFVNRRPVPKRVCNIGAWYQVLKLFAFTAVMTNVLLIGFTSQYQMSYYFPQFYDFPPAVAPSQLLDNTTNTTMTPFAEGGGQPAPQADDAESNNGVITTAADASIVSGDNNNDGDNTPPPPAAAPMMKKKNPVPVIKQGEGRFIVGTIFTIEHCLMFAVLMLYWLVPAVPLDVLLQIQRQKYRKFLDASARRNTNAGTRLWKAVMGSMKKQ